MMNTCKKSPLANGLCLWGVGLVASVVLATNASAFFGNNHADNYGEVDYKFYQNSNSNGSGKFKLAIEAEGEANMGTLADIKLDSKFYENYNNNNNEEYPKNYWY
jgi:hypothetical protein